MNSTSKACNRCKKLKCKCDGTRPICIRCLKHGCKDCRYPPDRRFDKRQRVNGIDKFIFKNGSSSRARRKEPDTQNVNRITPCNEQNSSSIDSDSNIADKWLELDISTFFDFDFDQFMNYLDLDFSIDAAQPADLENIMHQEPENHYCKLLDVVFSNDSHKPPGITKKMILDLIYKDKTPDEIFLQSLVLAIGALTLSKAELLNQSHSDSRISDNLSIPKVALEAYEYYTKAKNIIPQILETPTKNGFRGLVLLSNFITVLIPVRFQMVMSHNALQVAFSLGLHRVNYVDPESEDHDLIISFWGLWCSTCMVSSLHNVLPPLLKTHIKSTTNLKFPNEHTREFFFLRIDWADIQCKILQYKNTDIRDEYHQLNQDIIRLNERMNFLQEMVLNDYASYKRSELFNIELSCWKSQSIMLLSLPDLLNKVSIRAAIEAKRIIKELWNYYNPKIIHDIEFVKTLDWNFSFPLRTATLTLWLSCIVLSKYINLTDYLTFDIYEYKLCHSLLESLTNMFPINREIFSALENEKFLMSTMETPSLSEFIK